MMIAMRNPFAPPEELGPLIPFNKEASAVHAEYHAKLDALNAQAKALAISHIDDLRKLHPEIAADVFPSIDCDADGFRLPVPSQQAKVPAAPPAHAEWVGEIRKKIESGEEV